MNQKREVETRTAQLEEWGGEEAGGGWEDVEVVVDVVVGVERVSRVRRVRGSRERTDEGRGERRIFMMWIKVLEFEETWNIGSVRAPELDVSRCTWLVPCSRAVVERRKQWYRQIA